MSTPRRWTIAAGLAGLGAVALLLASGCVNHRYRHVSASEFLDLARAPMQPAFATAFIGSTNSRAYLSVWSAMPSSIGGGEKVCSCSLEELPPAIAAEIRAGRNPWPK